MPVHEPLDLSRLRATLEREGAHASFCYGRADGATRGTGWWVHRPLPSELAASKALDRPVGLFEDNGSIQQIYAW
jgi:hypothetical protein